MAFADKLPQVQLCVPGEDGEFFMVRHLGWRELDECRRAAALSQVEAVRAIGADTFAELAKMEQAASLAAAGAAAPAGIAADVAALAEAKARLAEEKKRKDQREQFDKQMLIDRSVMDWSYGDKFTKARLDHLDEATSDWLYGAIADLYVGAEDVDARGEDFTPSTVS